MIFGGKSSLNSEMVMGGGLLQINRPTWKPVISTKMGGHGSVAVILQRQVSLMPSVISTALFSLLFNLDFK